MEGFTNQQSVDFTGNCTAGTRFSLCEKTGIILTESIKSSISFKVPAAASGRSVCPSECEESCGFDAAKGPSKFEGLPGEDDNDNADGNNASLSSDDSDDLDDNEDKESDEDGIDDVDDKSDSS